MDKLTTQENKPEIIKRVSGTEYNPETKSGKAAIQHLKYKIQDPATGLYRIDTEAIKAKINEYLDKNEYVKETDEDGKEKILCRGVLSKTGLTRYIGLTRVDTLNLWANGYVSTSDIEQEDVIPNYELAEVVHAGKLAVQQYWEESDAKYSANKHIRLMETDGVIAGKDKPTIVNHGTMQLGIFDKWAK